MIVEIIRSERKTMSLEVRQDLSVIVRAPLRMPRALIDQFVQAHEAWIQEHQAHMERRQAARPEPTELERAGCIERAKIELPKRVSQFEQLVGVRAAGITITNARTRHGSCSAKNRLCFSWRLFLYPDAAIDYVIVHELCHILHHDHSKAFWTEVERVLPDYAARKRLLRTE